MHEKGFDDKLQSLQEKLRELEAVFAATHEEIFVTDETGMTIRVNPVCEQNYGVQGIELIGRNVYELVDAGIFSPSATVAVLEKKAPVTLIQNTSTGRKLIVSANPVFDENNQLKRVVSTSRDITEIISLKQQIEEMEKAIQYYVDQLHVLQKASVVPEGLIAKSTSMQHIIKLLSRLAPLDTTILLLGESGVGKTEVAKWIHENSARSKYPFVEVNCSTIPHHLFESELFGYEKGSFSGALTTGKIGLVEAAQNGTLFLDEIGELPLDLQTKLLQVMHSKTLLRVGGRQPIQADVRFIAATNKDLEKMVQEKKFRLDLYYRINVVPITIPPLRERQEDGLELIFNKLDYFNQKYHIQKVFSPQAIERLLSYEWPGNIRQLENMIERFVLTTESNVIQIENIEGSLVSRAQKQIPAATVQNEDYIQSILNQTNLSYKEMVEQFEHDLLEKAISLYPSTRKLATQLKVSQSTISRKISFMRVKE